MAVKKIAIITEDLKVDASLNDSKTAQNIWVHFLLKAQ